MQYSTAYISRLLGLLLLAPLLFSCARMEEDIYVLESLPYQGVKVRSTAGGTGRISCLATYDSTGRHDVLTTLLHYSETQRQVYERYATVFLGMSIDGGMDQKNFAFNRYPGLERVALVPLAFFPDTGNRPWTLYHMYFRDSIVVGLHGWGPSERWLQRLVLGCEDAHYLMPLVLWRPPGQDHWLYVFRKSNRIRYFREAVPDTLVIWDLSTGDVLVHRPIGMFCASQSENVQLGSLLRLQASNCENGLSYGGFDDAHSYVAGFRPDGSIAWADTLHVDRARPERQTSAAFIDGTVLLTSLVAPDRPTVSATSLTVCDAVGHDTLRRVILQAPLQGMFGGTRHPNGRREYYCLGWDGKVWVLDSAFTLQRFAPLPFATGLIHGIAGPETEMSLIASFERFVDVNGDSTNDFWEVSSSGQVVIIDGQTFAPLLATPPYPSLEKCGLVRRRNGGTALALWDRSALVMFDVTATPLSARILAHQDRIIIVSVLFLMLPLFAYFVWRVEYFRQLFRLLISESRDQGVLVVGMKSLGRTLLGIASPQRMAIAAAQERGLMVVRVRPPGRRSRTDAGAGVLKHNAARARATLTVNERMRTLLDVTAGGERDLNRYPAEVAELMAACFRDGVDRTIEIHIVDDRHARHLVVTARMMKLLGRFRRCVVTANDITESIEAERRRTLAENEAQHQREMLTTTVKIVHDAKTPLQTARLMLNAMMLDAAGPFLGATDAEREEQSAAIESSITEAVDIINRCLFLAREAQSSAGLRPTDLCSAVGAWCRKTESRYGGRGFTVRNEVPDDLPQLMLDQTGLEFLLQCASDNAVQWTPHDAAEKVVTIAAQQLDGAVLLEIIDTGVGMEPETVRRLLESPGFSQREMGSGLGMLIIHRVCAEHGARLSVTSMLAEGTTIAVAFPISADTPGNGS